MTEYKIIADSSCELPEQYKTDERIKLVPFRLEIDGVPLRDTSDLNTKSLLEKIVDSKAFIISRRWTGSNGALVVQTIFGDHMVK